MQFWLGPLLGAAGAAILYKYVFRHPEAAAAEAAAAKIEAAAADAEAAKAFKPSASEATHLAVASPVRPAHSGPSTAVRRTTTSVGTGGHTSLPVSVEAAPAPLLPVADTSEWR